MDNLFNSQEEIQEEILKCKNSPYYFATKYLTVKNHKGEITPFITNLTEEEFNNKFKKIIKDGIYN